MRQAAPITDAESELLRVLWRLGALTPPRLIAEVKAARPWGEATIKTLLARLKQKDLVRGQRDDGVLRYHPLITEAAYVEGEVEALTRRLFGGDRGALAAYLAKR